MTDNKLAAPITRLASSLKLNTDFLTATNITGDELKYVCANQILTSLTTATTEIRKDKSLTPESRQKKYSELEDIGAIKATFAVKDFAERSFDKVVDHNRIKFRSIRGDVPKAPAISAHQAKKMRVRALGLADTIRFGAKPIKPALELKPE